MDVTHLLAGVSVLGWGQVAMVAIGGLLIYLAIAKEYEPVLLLPISVGCLLATLPPSALTGEEGLLTLLYRIGVANELFPLLIFLGVGAMMDFRPLLAQPVFALMEVAGQFGIFDALGANTAGQLGPVIAGDVLLVLLGAG
jgi:Na+-transporting methylmalonyl-CoA/oxaloacetate decarboxylase beta subunit